MTRFLKTLLSGLLVPAATAPALAQSTGQNWPIPMHEWYWWWGPWHMLIPLIFLGVLVAAVVVLVRWLWPDERHPSVSLSGNRALDVLDELLVITDEDCRVPAGVG